MIKLASYHQHIDNGGVSINVDKTDDGFNQLIISMNTSYFGYPDITSKLHFWSYAPNKSNKDILKEIGLMFLSAAEKE